MACAVALFVFAFAAGTARSEGFVLRDLTVIEADVAAAFGDGYEHWAIPTTLHLGCCDGEEEQVVRLTVDRHTDEIGQQDRTDRDYISGLEQICAGLGPSCEIEEIDAGAALGRRVTVCMRVPLQTTSLFVVKDGDRLTIRSSATDATMARRNADKALRAAGALLLEGGRQLATRPAHEDGGPAPGCPGGAAS